MTTACRTSYLNTTRNYELRLKVHSALIYLAVWASLLTQLCRDGQIYFPDFCHFVLGKLREEDRDKGEDFRQNMFKVSYEE